MLAAALVLPAATPGPPSAQARAGAVARSLLASVAPPPGARPVAQAPPGALAQPAEIPGGQHLTDSARFWTVQASPDRVIAMAQAALPTGLVVSGAGSSWEHATLVERSLTLSMPAPPAGLWVAQLVLAAAPLAGGWSMLRVDAQVGVDPPGPRIHHVRQPAGLTA